MNQAQLRPPNRVFQSCWLFLAVPAVLYLACYTHMTELQRMYFPAFAKVSVIPSMEGRLSHRVILHDRTLYCLDGDTPAIDGIRDLSGIHPVLFPMATAQYKAWLTRFVYRAPLLQFLKRPLALSALILLPLLMGAWKLDRLRHLKFRSTARHVRGSQLLTRAEFQRNVRGEGSGWLVRRFFPAKAVEPGIGWRTESYREEI